MENFLNIHKERQIELAIYNTFYQSQIHKTVFRNFYPYLSNRQYCIRKEQWEKVLVEHQVQSY